MSSPMHGALQSLVSSNGAGPSIGLELPLDNDWSPAREAARRAEGDAGRPFGVPDLAQHARLAKLADRLGFRALWARDVPLYDPSFGDAAQVFEVFSYLGYLAGVTQRILLGTAAVVLPLREPVLTLKSAATVDQLSNGRLLLGVASGDRPVEYPIFERDFASRGERFREQVAMVRSWASGSLPAGIELLPRPAQPLPLLVAGLAQQTPEWIGAHMDGCLAYPGTPEDHARRSAQWRAVTAPTGEGTPKLKPYISFIHLDLADDANAPLERYRFGGRMGRHALVHELAALHAAGVQHVALHMRRNQRPVDETMQEIGEFVLPVFHTAQAVAA
ncbi:TIGR03571 family LLM class oxidoreductase [Variovorax sp. J22G73]|uniref:TIGR03571 family LLM class oxidoreductase n=1 Tax=unclassified Variovorax TaxID=663243 RepID=UPI0025765DB5|nr:MULTISPECIES: TIGR03571 family LLM class oxidoreductase [unclassified Variovorax]MDM0010247.1 TIGR03571 family LLM class oxidoreductase [Variovorax sp. J22R203]MDM0102709.1 TIGR03571 family LLM class oxidoreductase [Variovorax sp. J22G73]